MMRHIALALYAVVSAWACAVYAADTVETPRTRAVLMVGSGEVARGGTVSLGLSLALKPGWHTYWRTPGDSGLPATITWTLPKGMTVGPLQWPTPSRVPTGDLMNFGYEGEVILPVALMVDKTATVGSVEIAAKATWLACADVCIPEEGAFSLPLKIADHPTTGASPNAEVLAEAQLHIPQAAPWPVSITRVEKTLRIEAGPGPGLDRSVTANFFPDGDGVMDNAAPQDVIQSGGKVVLTVKAGSAQPETVTGVIAIEDPKTGRVGYEVSANVVAGHAPAGDITLWVAVCLAFLGGLILNVMPCVLPVLVMKVLAIMNHNATQSAFRRDAVIYTAGVIMAFTGLVAVLLILRHGGEAIGWGFQLQNPAIVAGLAGLMLLLGLNLSGVFTVGASVMGFGQGWVGGNAGGWGSYLTGVLAVVVATPCTAPFMGAALGFALTQTPLMTLVVFEGLALGLAFPYLLIAFVPAAARLMPRPGPWMGRLKQLLAFPMYGAGVWLTWVLAQQVAAPQFALGLAALLCVAFAAWCLGVAEETQTSGRGWRFMAVIAAAVGFAAIAALRPTMGPQSESRSEVAEPFTPQRLAALRAEGKPVFVNFTAAWCITCLVNERVALSRPEVAEALRNRRIAYLKADWTNRNPEITAALHDLGRDGVPVYVLYPAVGQAVLLPQILTPGLVVEALNAL